VIQPVVRLGANSDHVNILEDWTLLTVQSMTVHVVVKYSTRSKYIGESEIAWVWSSALVKVQLFNFGKHTFYAYFQKT
jgi:hypothetical protein